MPFRLLRYSPQPPGQFVYDQDWQGKKYHFDAQGLTIRQFAETIIVPFRQANGIPRASIAEAVQDVDYFTCARLNNEGCYDSNQVPGVSENKGGCGGCGAPVK